ncbi:MAG: cyclic nucleotide-binding domain-containing protein, partial [Candidatus Promineifilaceae bacterium]
SLTVGPGEFVAVIGKSGSGKSTLINMITGIDRPTYGEVIVGGQPIHTLTENEMALWRGRNVGIIFQFFQLLPTLTLLENVTLPMEFARQYNAKERKERALHLLGLVDMAEHAHKLPSAVSGGQQQRVAIARALANDPAVLVADEPTGSLDSKTADAVFQLFEDLVDQGKTILMVTHDRDLASRVSRVILIADGEVVDEYVSAALHIVDDAQLARVSTHLEPVTYAPGDIVFHQGDTADKFYIIISGEVEVVVRHPQRPELVIDHLGKGQFFGENGLLYDAPRSATVRVAGEKEALFVALDRDSFRMLVEENHMTHDAIARLMRRRMLNEQIMTAIPELTPEQLADLETHAELQLFVPGAIISEEGVKARYFYMVTKGAVEIIGRKDGRKQVVARLGPGQYFGEIGLYKDVVNIATLRAAPDVDGQVEVVAISLEQLRKIMDESGLTEQEMGRILRGRLSTVSSL